MESSRDISFTGCSILDETDKGEARISALLELSDCDRINVNGCQFINGYVGIEAEDCRNLNITGNTFHDSRETPISQHAIEAKGYSQLNLVSSNIIGVTRGKAILGKFHEANNVVDA